MEFLDCFNKTYSQFPEDSWKKSIGFFYGCEGGAITRKTVYDEMVLTK